MLLGRWSVVKMQNSRHPQRMGPFLELLDYHTSLRLISWIDRVGCYSSPEHFSARSDGFCESYVSAPWCQGACDLGVWLEGDTRADSRCKPI